MDDDPIPGLDTGQEGEIRPDLAADIVHGPGPGTFDPGDPGGNGKTHAHILAHQAAIVYFRRAGQGRRARVGEAFHFGW